jgi:hypothetical protein
VSDDDLLSVRKPERETLTGALDWYRAVAVNKVKDLSLEDASRIMTPSGLSPLGIVKHLTWVEAGWFRDTFAGTYEGEEESNEDSFKIRGGDTVASIVAAYEAECASSRTIVAGAALDDLSVNEAVVYGLVSLRWVVVHMLEETAHHVGHLDLMREQLDGRTGF